MRLIDADALIKTLETYKFGAIQNEVERAYIKETVINFVKDAPTAYDPEAVVAEVQNMHLPLASQTIRIVKCIRKGGV